MKKCQRKYHTALLDDNIQATKCTSQSILQIQFTPQQQPNQTSLGASQPTPPLPHTKINSILITVPVTLELYKKFVSTYLLDMGSSSRYVQKNIAEQLQVPFHQKSEKLLIGGFHQSLQILSHQVNMKSP